MTRAGGATRRPEGDFSSASESDTVFAAAGCGGGASGGGVARGGGLPGGGVELIGGKVCDAGFCGKSGVVFAVGGAPVRGGAEGLGGGVVGALAGGVLSFDTLGIGFVTAVDHAGGALVTGAGTNCPEVFIGSVVAAETFGLGVGVIFPVEGRNGRGGRLMRNVSRFGAFGSDP